MALTKVRVIETSTFKYTMNLFKYDLFKHYLLKFNILSPSHSYKCSRGHAYSMCYIRGVMRNSIGEISPTH